MNKNIPLSCDTFGFKAKISKCGYNVLAKNSDRPAFDCQVLVANSKRKNVKGSKLSLAYVTIDDAKETIATIGSAPYWCWGYEEGINAYGVAIGNEAIYTKPLALNKKKATKKELKKGLLGMELVRLGLERGKNAREAVEVMTSLLEKYGQWGSGVPTSNHIDGAYDNSYMIADSKELWVLETTGKEWIARKVDEDYVAISNEPSIRNKYTLISKNLINNASKKGWTDKEFDFAHDYTDYETSLQVSHIRVQRSRDLLKKFSSGNKKITIQNVKSILRDHYDDTFLNGPYFNAALPDFLSICMHSSPAGFTWGNTSSSAINILPNDDKHLPMFWYTPVTPCTGLYFPVFAIEENLPEVLAKAGKQTGKLVAPTNAKADTYKDGSYWWKFRKLLDVAKGNEAGDRFNERHDIIRKRFDVLEEKWIKEKEIVEKEAIKLLKKDKEKAVKLLEKFTADCVKEGYDEAEKLINEFLKITSS